MLNNCKAAFKDCNDPQIEPEIPDTKPIATFLMTPKTGEEPLEICEIHWVLRKYFPNIPQSSAVVIAKLIDENNDGTIQRSEFNRLIIILEQVKEDEDIIDVVFAACDKNKNKLMEQREFQILKEKLHLEFEIPLNPMNKEEFKFFMRPFIGHLTGSDLVPYTSELQQYLVEEAVVLDKLKTKIMSMISKKDKKGEIVAKPDTIFDQSASNVKMIQPEAIMQQSTQQENEILQKQKENEVLQKSTTE
ncbi:EF-hand_domain pair [Hexamita inflata]|uniref:EF-hand domain pair n=1 Tax=Hexamita inflata TaxID=28002 RepID=A0AA86P663_9EUKA|nr:EF-hand domain pair [Hexamita inflata]